MAKRITQGVERASAIEILVDDARIESFPGETVATALIAAGRWIHGFNWDHRARAPVCNMGVCFECLIQIHSHADDADEFQLQRACMTHVAEGMVIRTARHRNSRADG